VSGSISGCNYDAVLNNSNNILLNASSSLTPSFNSRNAIGGQGQHSCENLNRIDGTSKIFDNWGDIIKSACNGTGALPSVDPNGGNGYCIEVSNPQSNLSTAQPPLVIFKEHNLYMTAAAHTVTYNIQNNLASGITAGSLRLIANYIGMSGVRTETTGQPAIAARATAADWSNTIAVTFTPTVTGWVTFRLEYYQYESGKAVYVWPTPVIS
jgi:hypothetical protein